MNLWTKLPEFASDYDIRFSHTRTKEHIKNLCNQKHVFHNKVIRTPQTKDRHTVVFFKVQDFVGFGIKPR